MDIKHLVFLLQLCMQLAVSKECGEKESNQINQKYNQCQSKAYNDYKDRKRKIAKENLSSRRQATCQYFVKVADGCGEILSSCYSQETIRDITDQLISSRLIPDVSDASDVPTSATCPVLALFNQRKSTNEATGNEILQECSKSEEESIKSGMNECYSDVVKNMYDAMENLTNKVDLSDLVCQALTNITDHCIQDLHKCHSTVYVARKRRQQLQRFHPYLIDLTKGRADNDSLKNCPVINNKANAAGAQVITAPDEHEENVEHIAKSASVHEETEATAKATYIEHVQELGEAGQDLPINPTTEHTPENIELIDNPVNTDATAPVGVDNAVDNERLTWSNPNGNANISRITSLAILLCFTAYFLL